MHPGSGFAPDGTVWGFFTRLPGQLPPAVTDVIIAVTTVTGPTAMAVLALLIAGAEFARSRRWAVWLLPVAVLAANLASHLLKAFIGRERPPEPYRLIAETNPAFPSGHATGVAAVATVLTLWWWPRHRRVVIGVWAGAGIVCLTRLYLGVHWLTDILGGIALGTGVALAVSGWMFRPRIDT